MPAVSKPAAIRSAPRSNSAYVQLAVSATSAIASGLAPACSATSCTTSRAASSSAAESIARSGERTIAASALTSESAYWRACTALSAAGSPLTRSDSRPVRGSIPAVTHSG